ncbi:flagellar basal body rod protein FlgB [Bacillus lacus]|uniref:Flagellar basal body rod protein FlgB n=1 Tax=Metabacillus lacus TaxID=1983721 RepID=A0A7X2IWS6_9BACI|nr:flagellar basal body rod protein FlgB [Metabacillus lacus]MRX70588.1 flagellar basal body rod protein FlgB [Metabacillus lacus]
MKIFSGTFDVLEKGIQYSSQNQKMIANNIANVDTPNYKTQHASFSSFLKKETKTLQAHVTDHKHIQFSGGDRRKVTDGALASNYNHNGNNVDIDKEMALLAENQIFHSAVMDRLNGKFNSLKTVVRGGK